jgi:pilus assembly protein Flp/PilA
MIRNFMMHVSTMVGNKKGQAMVEYGIIVALISIAAITAIVLIGPQLLAAFTTVTTNLP